MSTCLCINKAGEPIPTALTIPTATTTATTITTATTYYHNWLACHGATKWLSSAKKWLCPVYTYASVHMYKYINGL